MMNRMKKMFLTGMVVMVMMSFATPAMALENGQSTRPTGYGFGGTPTLITATSNQR
jgi:hypothetical protein